MTLNYIIRTLKLFILAYYRKLKRNIENQYQIAV
jgi:hypothetical protein